MSKHQFICVPNFAVDGTKTYCNQFPTNRCGVCQKTVQDFSRKMAAVISLTCSVKGLLREPFAISRCLTPCGQGRRSVRAFPFLINGCLQGVHSREKAMAKQPREKTCVVFIHEDGDTRRRFVDEIKWFVKDRPEKTLSGNRLPRSISLRLGKSQEARSVLELFDVKAPKRTLSIEPAPWPTGRDVICGIFAVSAFQILLAIFDAVARSANL